MKRKTALVAGLAVLVLLVGVALALELWPCPNCDYTPMTAYYTCANHVPAYSHTGPAYIDPNNPPPPPAQDNCPECGNPCEADSVVCPNCDWSWHRQ
jgi:hypothetical protein